MRIAQNPKTLVLSDIIDAIGNLWMPIFKKAHVVASEIDEIKFGVYILAASREMALPPEFLARTALRVLQLLTNPANSFEKAEGLKLQMKRAYLLLRQDDMPFFHEIRHEHSKPLFHAHNNPPLIKALVNAGLPRYFVNEDLTTNQRIISRLNYYLANFEFPMEWVHELNFSLLYSNDQTSLETSLDIIYGLANRLSKEDERTQFLALACLVITDEDTDIEAEFKSCYYPDKTYRNLLCAIAAKLPADIIKSKLRNFLQYEDRTLYQTQICNKFLAQLPTKLEAENSKNPNPKLVITKELQQIAVGLGLHEEKISKEASRKIMEALKENKGESKAINIIRDLKSKHLEQLSEILKTAISENCSIYESVIEIEGSIYCLAENLNKDFSIQPLTLAGSKQEFETVKNIFLQTLSGSTLQAGCIQSTEENLSTSIKFYRSGKNPLDTFLVIKHFQNEITITFDLHFLSKDQIRDLLLRIITAISPVKSAYIQPLKNTDVILKQVGEAKDSTDRLLETNFTPDPDTKARTRDTLSELCLTEQRLEESKLYNQIYLDIIKNAIQNLEYILGLHDLIDLSKRQTPREEQPLPKLNSTSSTTIDPQSPANTSLAPPSIETPIQNTPVTPANFGTHRNTAFSERSKTPTTPMGEALRSSPDEGRLEL